MPLNPGDVVVYVSKYHDVGEDERGRICKSFGVEYVWVHFSELGCQLVKRTSLKKVTGEAPQCRGCPRDG